MLSQVAIRAKRHKVLERIITPLAPLDLFEGARHPITGDGAIGAANPRNAALHHLRLAGDYHHMGVLLGNLPPCIRLLFAKHLTSPFRRLELGLFAITFRSSHQTSVEADACRFQTRRFFPLRGSLGRSSIRAEPRNMAYL